MTSFFDLSESKKRNLSIPELHNYAERLEINVYKTSEKSGKNIKKTKQELIDEIDSVYIRNKVEKSIEKKKNNKLSKVQDKHTVKIILYLTSEELDECNLDEEFNKNKFNEKYIEKKFNTKISFGNIIYYDNFYFYNKDKKFVLMPKIRDNYVNIPRIISKNYTNVVHFFDKLNDERMNIGSIELSREDIYVSNKIEIDKSDKLNGINFNYVYSFINNKYYFEIELNYLGQKNVINETFETFKFFPKEDLSLIQLIDFHNKLSVQKFYFSFKIFGPPENDIFIDNWKDDLIIEKYESNKGNITDNNDSSYECNGYTTMYAKFENISFIKNKFTEELNNEETDKCYIVKDKEYLKFKENVFDDFVNNLGIDIINFDLKKKI